MPFEISGLKSVSSWIELIRDRNSDFISKLRQIYGDNDDLKIEAARMCLCSLGAFAERYGADRNVTIIRSAGRADIMKLLPECEREIRHAFRSHAEPRDGYPIRQICLYGIAECIRAEMAPQCLRAGDMKTFGELINTSHDGDRVTKLVEGRRVPIDNSYPDERIDALVGDLESGDAGRISRAELWRQGGGYNVSLHELDILVDIALATEGVIGAGLVGAGMGGCIVAVVEDGHAEQLIENMAEKYYQPRNLLARAEIVTPVGGLCSMD